jgi:hypothetical protein
MSLLGILLVLAYLYRTKLCVVKPTSTRKGSPAEALPKPPKPRSVPSNPPGVRPPTALNPSPRKRPNPLLIIPQSVSIAPRHLIGRKSPSIISNHVAVTVYTNGLISQSYVEPAIYRRVILPEMSIRPYWLFSVIGPSCRNQSSSGFELAVRPSVGDVVHEG